MNAYKDEEQKLRNRLKKISVYGLTQAKISRHCDVPKHTLSRFLAGKGIKGEYALRLHNFSCLFTWYGDE